ncbi:glycosyltransferase family 39 protein [Actinomadura sediminis]|uniref:Glycosyltransferase family 39 protein n=1 Tax=Actinomadura sediminis TaxID=1038904 RepID=A0ABW3EMZ0_9ACTN
MRTESARPGARARADEGAAPAHRRLTSLWWAGMAGCLAVALALRTWHTADDVGLGNSYYTATALSMSKDWVSFLTGSLDTGHFITMDKPPVGLWPSAVLIGVFGVNWATVFLPNAVAGTASVLVLALAVREGGGDSPAARATALLAALGLAVSPINVAIERDNNPDAMLLLVTLLAAWLTLRAIRRGRLRPLLGAGALVGLGFDIKYLEAYVVLPALALAWLVAGAVPIRRRIGWLAAAAVPLVAVSAAWPVLFRLVPSGERPWVGNSTDGTVASRIGQIFQQHLQTKTGARPDDMGAQIVHAFETGQAFHAGQAGAARLFDGVLADQVSWWLPLAVVGAVTVAYDLRRRSGGPDGPSPWAGWALWTGWAVCAWGVFSFMQGVLHPYYTSLLVPALAALAAAGLVTAWSAWRRGEAFGIAALAAHVLAAAAWAAWVLHDTSAQYPGWLPPVVITAGVLAAAALASPRGVTAVAAAAAAATAVAALAAPLVWSVKTTQTRLLGINPLANQDGRFRLAGLPPPVGEGILGVIEGSRHVDPALLGYLIRNQGDARWIVAVPSGLQGAPMIIASDGRPVLAMGGFDGSNPTPTPERFRRLVADGDIRFVLASPPGPGFTGFGSGPSAQVSAWALEACRPVDPRTGRAPQGGPPQGAPPQGAPPQGAPPQGTPPQGTPPQGAPPQGGPPQGGPQGGPPGLILLDCVGAAA